MNKINQLQETESLKPEIYQFAGIAEQLVNAAEADNLEEVKALINSGIKASSANYLGLTALHYACKKGNLEMVKTLITQGTDLNVRSFFGYVPLLQAYNKGHYEIIDMLIEKGADVNIADKFGFTLLHLACNNVAGINRDCKLRNLKLIETLIAAGGNVNKPNEFGATPLFYAAMRGYKKAVELLVASGADINVRLNEGYEGAMGYTPCEWAEFYSQKETVKLLEQLNNNKGKYDKVA